MARYKERAERPRHPRPHAHASEVRRGFLKKNKKLGRVRHCSFVALCQLTSACRGALCAFPGAGRQADPGGELHAESRWTARTPPTRTGATLCIGVGEEELEPVSGADGAVCADREALRAVCRPLVCVCVCVCVCGASRQTPAPVGVRRVLNRSPGHAPSHAR